MSKTTLLVITDGRQGVLDQTLSSARKNLGEFDYYTMVDDSNNQNYAEELDAKYPEFSIYHANEKLGFDGSIRIGWSILPQDTDYIFHLEDDFLILEQINLDEMRWILEHRLDIQQVALKRQPWNENEKIAGGVVEMWPSAYTNHWESMINVAWCEHQLFFTTNPSLYRKSLCEIGWPNGEGSEHKFFQRVIDKNPKAIFAYLGLKSEEPKVLHIGYNRAGTGY